MKSDLRTRLRRRYGEGPLHLLLLAASFSLAGYAGIRLLDGEPVAVAVWFVGAALVHDLLLVPLYAAADRGLRALCGPIPDQVSFVRVPALLSGLLLLVWFPLIAGRVERYGPATGLPADVFLGRWLLLTAALFGASAASALLRARRRRRSTTKGRPPATH